MKNCLTIILLFTSILLMGQDSPGVYTIKNAKVNTLDSDFGTAFYGDDKVVFAAPKQGFTLSREENSGQPFLDLYVGEVTEDGQIIKKQKLPGEINTKYHEGMVTFTKDLKTVYFSANNFIKQNKKKNKKKATGYLHLFRASITESGEWINLTMLPFNGEKFSTGHPVLNKDDTKLYFVSDRPESYGKTDLFVVDVNEDGSFGEPRNLGAKINTADREMFPFIGKDNVLYYSSDGLPGLGELDIFASKIFDSTQSAPINLEEPVNSEFDDFAYIIDDHKNRGYFSSNRGGGHGDDDIYSFVASPPIYIECLQEITGVVMDIDTQELIPDALIILYDAKGVELGSFVSNKEDAAFTFQQSCNSTYTIKGYLEGYLIGELDIKTVNDLDAEPIDIIFNLTLDPNKANDVIAGVDASNSQDDNAVDIDSEDTSVAQSDSVVQKESGVTATALAVTAGGLHDESEDATLSEPNSSNLYDESTAVALESEEMAEGIGNEAYDTVADSNNVSNKDVTKEGAASINETNKDVSKEGSTIANSKKEMNSGANQAVVAAAVLSTNNKDESEGQVTSNELESQNEVNKASAEIEYEEVSISDTEADTNSDVYASSTLVNSNEEGIINEAVEEVEIAEMSTENSEYKNSTSTPVSDSELEDESVVESIPEGNKSATETSEVVSEVTSISGQEAINQETSRAEAQESAGITSSAIAMNMSDVSEENQASKTASSPIEAGTEGIRINTIYFDYDKFDIRFDAKIELDKIAVVMEQNPKAKIKVNSHTDIRGKKSYNLKLSNSRARKTVEYLLNKGIEEDRITGEGHGELEVAEICTKEKPCTGLQHQLNRRSEFLIIDSFSEAVIAQSMNKSATGNYAVNDNVSNSGAYVNYDFSDSREVYTVQVGAFKGEVQSKKYKKLTDLFNYRYEDGLNRYYAGIFETSAEARDYMKKMRKDGFADAFVVGLKGTNRF